ncbi:MAG: glycogen debranching enzyme GlgX [Candidatus Methylumidiphilus alinenensis]|uniref:Glycogen debranching enzyme GlgX n=1 Tax=Candidatus Methylumidiphilus alinenensis TaxID=2202197 RepID=A0A2W4QZE6_9GAMM|nr:MAG: glycogen debranching enzyme GlgX [Candidatus Methylumidiphilus alinenensis]
MMKPPFDHTIGSPMPLGVYLQQGGINFTLFSRNATRVFLLLFDNAEDSKPSQVVELDPNHYRTGDIWHVFVKGACLGQIYAFKVEGPHEPGQGHLFCPNAILLDPYASAVASPQPWNFIRCCDLEHATAEQSAAGMAKSLVIHNGFDWEDDRRLKRQWPELVIYETHVKGFTIHPSAAGSNPGTFLGFIEKISYLQELGVNAVELMPLQEFNPQELTAKNPFTKEPLVNYWGYNTVGFFAPHDGYGTRRYPGCQVDEFKTLVKALHKAGIEVLLDVVFNHTAEGNQTGPTLSFRGLDNSIYYLLEEDKKYYKNYSGCGNTLNCNHPVVRNFILDCLRYWVVEMHVDGFRFDLASILGRDRSGHLTPNPPLLEQIAEDPILREVKLIAEAWDAGGAYLVGRFPGERWSEWNGHYRDDIRRFWRGEQAMAGILANRLCGSADLYDHSGKAPVNSINFITCHDGFTLNDLVSFHHKHNLANAEENRDGCDYNFSSNYGVEGPTENEAINRIRLKQKKNMLATLFLSRGIPMLLGGDEFGRTQHGNNNAYCQDNEISWFDWGLLERNRELFQFVQGLIAFRKFNQVLSLERFYRKDEIVWFSSQGLPPRWEVESCLGCRIHAGTNGDGGLCLLFNPTTQCVDFALPSLPRDRVWLKAIDTNAPMGEDISPEGRGMSLSGYSNFQVMDHSLIVLTLGKRG